MSRDLRSQLKGILPNDKLSLASRSFELIGSKQKAIAIIEISEDLKDFETQIASAIMKIHKNVSSVLAKESEREGDFRIRRLRLIAGGTDTEVVHKESGCLFRLDPVKVYFSSRESAERERLSNRVKDGESVLVMFSGVCPIPIVLAKKFQNVKITAIELNPLAHDYCVQNIHLNRVEDRIEALLGDVRGICPKLKTKFNRIIMPLPKGAHRFLDCAIPLTVKGGVIHLYHWSPEPDLFTESEKLIFREAKKHLKSVEILEEVKVSQYSPRIWKIRLDVRLS